jgi:hypothetical protein
MNVVYERCAGLDVHQKSIVACVRVVAEGRVSHEVRTFSTMTSELLALADWLAACGCTHVAMESTGVFWKPVWHVLERLRVGPKIGRAELLGNSRHACRQLERARKLPACGAKVEHHGGDQDLRHRIGRRGELLRSREALGGFLHASSGVEHVAAPRGAECGHGPAGQIVADWGAA